WADLNGNLQITQFFGVGLDPFTVGTVYGGSQDNGNEKTTGSLVWDHIGPGDGGGIQVDPANAGTYYAMQNATLIKTTNSDASFGTTSIANIGVPEVFPNTTFAIALNPARTNRLWYGDHELQMTIDGGTTSAQITTVGSLGWNVSGGAVDAIASAPSNVST